ncbi:MAG: 3-deoxy-manno-octulosonate cytidylyltransferase [Candidatus Aminicenantes bacterium]|nr:3-deoxy-manno-octulosonate cytidylyltransferase [Candidatus Aminicenantes bacterium]MDH5383242.1 3-deoxy-manno-octulosonate cytidylyltransferase [Candidatus Aminicenantes bacterium]MDH5742758.1 3-deoxy-manno-octulosonate cytidylyltransferase [Candidatus Aminicenantes bacterium]
MKDATGIIPARYGAKRFPGKPLALIGGKPMIQRVYEQTQEAELLRRIIIATDDERILEVCRAFGAEVQMTSSDHQSGTERVAEVAEKLETPIIINIQGDEPLLRGQMIDDLIKALQDNSVPMATLAAKVNDLHLMDDRDIVKVVVDKDGYALYFSRAPLPFQPSDYFWQHVGIYGYQRNFLLEFRKMPVSRLERCEKLEQLRALENGFKIKVIETDSPTLSVDTPQDIIKLEKYLETRRDV